MNRARKVAHECSCILLILAAMSPALAQKPSNHPSSTDKGKQTPLQQAWRVLKAGISDSSTDRRAIAVRVLGLAPGNAEALALAEQSLTDDKSEVRAAAATALGQMHARHAIPKLQKALDDIDTSVALAAANALRDMKDPAAYSVYYAVLAGRIKVSKGLVAQQLQILKDPKKLAMLGFQEGIGQTPFAGMGYSVYEALRKDDTSPVRAAAAKALAHDPDPLSAQALVQAAFDESWLVRAAAVDAIAHRGDPALIPKIENELYDDNDTARLTAAAAIIRLSSVSPKKSKTRKRERGNKSSNQGL
jgi:HEAT repeat protein